MNVEYISVSIVPAGIMPGQEEAGSGMYNVPVALTGIAMTKG